MESSGDIYDNIYIYLHLIEEEKLKKLFESANE